jgi:Tfp pilus assembly ATPase PilU
MITRLREAALDTTPPDSSEIAIPSSSAGRSESLASISGIIRSVAKASHSDLSLLSSSRFRIFACFDRRWNVEAAAPRPMIRRIVTAIPTAIPALAPVERPELVGGTCISKVSVLVVSVTGSGVGLVVIISPVGGKHGASDGHGVCETVSSGIVLTVLMLLES